MIPEMYNEMRNIMIAVSNASFMMSMDDDQGTADYLNMIKKHVEALDHYLFSKPQIITEDYLRPITDSADTLVNAASLSLEPLMTLGRITADEAAIICANIVTLAPNPSV